MAVARLALKNLQQRLASPSPLLHQSFNDRSLGTVKKQRWGCDLLRRLSATAGDEKSSSDGQEVAVSEGGKKSKLFPRRQRKRAPWRNNAPDFVPALYEFFPSGLGNALLQATENINKLFENLAPSRLMGRIKEQDQCYKLRFEVPGLAKEDVKITVEDGILTIKGEHKEEEEEGSDDEHWSSRSYGYYNTCLVLPDDAKAEEIKAEVKDGVLWITIPKTEGQKKDAKVVQVQ
ncbi:hypothetical protein F0562_023065 [Nyssa sinensis]|uniref:Small heat shock protein, chloroplastic n=1 Tax=Nyssa sinensis TaxID=561372 RepID=A0A5J5BFK1_9ASTE|nr:hypothetical protein F0562_023065 [Nyssa sinensis]